MDDIKHKAKIESLKHMRAVASKMMQDKMSPALKKVSVMAPDKAGLKEGLEKAKEILGGEPKEEHAEGSIADALKEHESEELPEEEGSESPELEALESEEGSEDGKEMPKTLEEVEQKIKELELLKAQLLKK